MWPIEAERAAEEFLNYPNASGALTISRRAHAAWRAGRCGLRGWPKDVQRTVFQPVAVAIFLMSALWIGARGAITPDIVKLFLAGLPALFAAPWLGLKLFGRFDDATFRRVVLVLLLVSGIVWPV